jgi:hypothetical protein
MSKGKSDVLRELPFKKLLQGHVVVPPRVQSHCNLHDLFEAYKNTPQISLALDEIEIPERNSDGMDFSNDYWYSPNHKKFYPWESNAWAYPLSPSDYHNLDDLHKRIFSHWLFHWPMSTADVHIDMGLYEYYRSWIEEYDFDDDEGLFMKFYEMEPDNIDHSVLQKVVKFEPELETAAAVLTAFENELNFWSSMHAKRYSISTVKRWLTNKEVDGVYREFLLHYLDHIPQCHKFNEVFGHMADVEQNMIVTTHIYDVVYDYLWSSGEYNIPYPDDDNIFYQHSIKELEEIIKAFQYMGKNLVLF